MADVTARHALVDPRAVRVRVAGAVDGPDADVVVIAPAAPALRMTNPTVGVGPLGGVTIAEPETAPDGDAPGGEPAGVVAQRHVEIDGATADVELADLGHGRHRLTIDGESTRVVLGRARTDGGLTRREVLVDGFRFEIDVESERIAALRERAQRGRAASAHSGPLDVRAIIPGKVASVSVVAGDTVTAGQQLLVVEAMKMQNELRAPRDGTIDRVGVEPGTRIEVGDLLVVIS